MYYIKLFTRSHRGNEPSERPSEDLRTKTRVIGVNCPFMAQTRQVTVLKWLDGQIRVFVCEGHNLR